MSVSQKSVSERYLDYVQTLYMREVEVQKRDGATIWVLMAAMVFVLWDIFSRIEHASIDDGFFIHLLIMFAMMYVSVVSVLLLLESRSKCLSRPYDYRIGGTAQSYIRKVAWFVLYACFIPGMAAWYALDSGYVQTEFAANQLLANKWLFNVVGVLTLGVYAIQYFIGNSIKDYPDPMRIPGNSTTDRDHLIFMAVIFALLIGNSYSLAKEYVLSSYEYKHVSLIVSFNTTIILILLDELRIKKSRSTNLVALERLERDIIMHDIDEPQIKRALEEEYLGRAIGDWLRQELSRVAEKSDELVAHMNLIENVESGLSELDATLVHERRGRINEFSEVLNSKYKDFESMNEKLVTWLMLAVATPSGKSDGYVHEILDKALQGQKSLRATIDSQHQIVERRIETIRA